MGTRGVTGIEDNTRVGRVVGVVFRVVVRVEADGEVASDSRVPVVVASVSVAEGAVGSALSPVVAADAVVMETFPPDEEGVFDTGFAVLHAAIAVI